MGRATAPRSARRDDKEVLKAVLQDFAHSALWPKRGRGQNELLKRAMLKPQIRNAAGLETFNPKVTCWLGNGLQGDPARGRTKMQGRPRCFFTPCADAGSDPGRMDRAWEPQRDPKPGSKKPFTGLCEVLFRPPAMTQDGWNGDPQQAAERPNEGPKNAGHPGFLFRPRTREKLFKQYRTSGVKQPRGMGIQPGRM